MKRLLTLIFSSVSCILMIFIVLSLDIHRDRRHKFDYSYLFPENIYSFFFPIVFVEEKGIGTKLNFNPPKKSLCPQRVKFFNDPKYLETLEFIPEKDNENNGSKIIKFNMYAGKSIKASTLITNTKNFFTKSSINLKIMEENSSRKGSIETSVLSIAYTYKGRRELMRIKAFSGSINSASVQYIVALRDNEIEDNVFEEIKFWMEDPLNLTLIDF